MVFFISCGFLTLTNLVYLLWASGKMQPWNEPEREHIENGIAEKAANDDSGEIETKTSKEKREGN